MRKQRQYPTDGGPSLTTGLPRPGRVVIPAAANDNARPAATRAAVLALAAALAVMLGWVGLRLLG